MNFLELCQRTRSEAGISGVGPASTTNQVGELKRLVDWVSTAYEDIQLSRTNWMWMRKTFQFNTTANDEDYTAAEAGIASRFAMWDVDSIRIYQTSIGVSNEFSIPFLDFSNFRRIYQTGSQSAGTPICFSIAPDLKLLLGTKPDGVYTVTGEYWQSTQTLANDSDIPELPTDYHMLIVWQALEYYGFYESAAEVVSRAQKQIRRYKNRLELNQLPDMMMARPLS
jgi:hypothetical protein